MSLVSQVTARYSAAALLQLTNPDLPSATSVDTARLGYAADDVAAEFEVRAGVEYDDTNAKHVAVCVEGVVAFLTWRMGTKGGADLVEAWRKRADVFGRTMGRDAIMPGTNSLLQPTVPGANGVTVRPPFDDTKLGGVLLAAPHSPSADVDIGE